MPTEYPTATLDTPYGKIRATLQGRDVIYVQDEVQAATRDRGGLTIRSRPAYANMHAWFVPGHGWTFDGPDGRRSYHWQSPKWMDRNGNGSDATGPAAVANFKETVAAILAHWATDEMRAVAAAAENAENRAALAASAARLRAVADDLDALAALETPPAGLSHITDLRRAEDEIAAHLAAANGNTCGTWSVQ